MALKTYPCPVCALDGYLCDDPHGHPSYEICPQCGTEFGYSDFTKSHAELRAKWEAGGKAWWSKVTPPPR